MKTLIALLVAANGFLAFAEPADARKAKRAQVQSTDRASAARARTSSHDTVRAESVDPAGNYKAYPDWARAAFGGKNPSSR